MPFVYFQIFVFHKKKKGGKFKKKEENTNPKVSDWVQKEKKMYVGTFFFSFSLLSLFLFPYFFLCLSLTCYFSITKIKSSYFFLLMCHDNKILINMHKILFHKIYTFILYIFDVFPSYFLLLYSHHLHY